MNKSFKTAIAAGLILAGAASAKAMTEDTHPHRSVYRIRSGGGIPTVIVRGDGCLQAEDMTRLRLVDWDPAHSRVIYKCIQP